jgi:hypothetical protein
MDQAFESTQIDTKINEKHILVHSRNLSDSFWFYIYMILKYFKWINHDKPW